MQPQAPTRLIFLPGLGADHRLFKPQLAAFKNSACPKWIPHQREASLASYAARFAATLPASDPPVLVGFSFGGMVALELARILPVERRPLGVVLISGVRSARAVSPAFKAQQAIGSLIPHAIAHTLIAGPLTTVFAKRDRLDAQQATLLREMASDIDTRFLFWAARACASWTHDGRVPVPVAHIHWQHDSVIPYVPHPSLQGGEAELVDAGHLISWTAADEVNAFIARSVAAFASRGPDPVDRADTAPYDDPVARD